MPRHAPRPVPAQPALPIPVPRARTARGGTTAARCVALIVLSAVVMLLGAGPALAHTRLLGSDPADGTTLAAAPERVSLEFNEAMQAEFSTVTVTGPDGAAWQTGPVAADGTTVSVALLPLGPAGRYEIGYRVVSDDGHPVAGTVGFVLSAPGPGADGAAAPAAPQAQAVAAPVPDGGPLVWPWIAGAVLLVAGGVAVALRSGRAQR
ncbi:MAG: copper resistance CopC family protein [Pseudonocardia sp.]